MPKKSAITILGCRPKSAGDGRYLLVQVSGGGSKAKLQILELTATKSVSFRPKRGEFLGDFGPKDLKNVDGLLEWAE